MANAKILASVGGKPITEEDVNQFLASLGQRGQAYQNPQGRAMILEQLINRQLLLLDATRNLYEREPEFKAQLAKVKEDMLSNYAVEKAVSGVRVTDEEVRKYFDTHEEQFKGEETVNASHILVSDEAKCQEIIDAVRAGEISFEDAARQYSSCPSSAQGGNLGDFGRGQMVPEFDQACFAMEVGEIAGPIKTQFGYHAIRLNSKNDAQPLSFEQVADQIRQRLLADKQQAAYQSKVNQLKILYPVDKY